MRKLLMVMVLLAVQAMMGSPSMAVSYPPLVPEPIKEDAVFRTGARVRLFHSGTQDVHSLIRVGDVLAVYHVYPPEPWSPTAPSGRVRVIGTLGEYYFEGEIVDGFAQPGSLAIKDRAACLVTTHLKER